MYVRLSTQFHDRLFLIMGDLNCRTGNLPDFQIFENNVHILEEYEDVFDTFNEPRVSSDKHITSLGRRLLMFCKLYTIYTVNGRLRDDKSKDHYTYIGPNGCSIIDYVLASKQLFDYISNFNVEMRTECTHMPIKVQFLHSISPSLTDAHDNTNANNNYNKISGAKIFSKSKKNIDAFKQNMQNTLNENFNSNIMNKISDTTVDTDLIISDIVNAIASCAIENIPHKKGKSQEPWFDQECEILKRHKIRFLHKFRQSNSTDDLEN